MKKLQKILLAFGTLGTVAAPLAAVVACDNVAKNNEVKSKPNLMKAEDLKKTYHIEQLHLDHNKDGVENFAFVGHIPEPSNKAASTY